MLEAIENYPPPSLKGKYVKIKYITQLPTHAPSFAFYCNTFMLYSAAFTHIPFLKTNAKVILKDEK